MTALPRARDLGELIILVPHLLGYRPEHSLVVVGLDQGKVRALGRIDLPPPGSHLLTSGQGATVEPGVLRAPAATVMAGSDSSGRPQVTTAQARELAGQVRARSELALLVAFESVRAASADTVDRVRVACEALELPIVESVRVRSGTWYRVVAGVEVDAHRLPRPADVPAVAEFVYRGYGVVGTREDLAASLGRPRGDLAAAAEALHRISAHPRLPEALDASGGSGDGPRGRSGLAAAWRQILAPEPAADPTLLDPDEGCWETGILVAALTSLTDVDVRDAIACWLAPAYVDDPLLSAGACRLLREIGPGAEGRDVDHDVQRRLIALCQSTPTPAKPPVLSLLAIHAWSQGDGTLARLAVDDALRCDPGYPLAQLFSAILTAGICRPARERADLFARIEAPAA